MEKQDGSLTETGSTAESGTEGCREQLAETMEDETRLRRFKRTIRPPGRLNL